MSAERQKRYRDKKKEQERAYADADRGAQLAHAEINSMRVGRGQEPLDDEALAQRVARARRYVDVMQRYREEHDEPVDSRAAPRSGTG